MSTSRQRFGIRARLLLAFAAVASTTVIASFTAWLLFSHVGALLNGIATHSIPGVVATLQLSTETQALVANAPNLLAADSDERRVEQRKALQGMQDAVTRQLDVVAGFATDTSSIDALRKLVAAMNDKVTAIDGSVARRLGLAAQRVAMARKTDQIQAGIVGLLKPVIEKSQGDITMVSMSLGGDPSEATKTLLTLVSRQVPFIEGVSDLSSDVGALGAFLDRSDSAPDATTVNDMRKQFTDTAAHAAERLDVVETLQSTPQLRPAVEQLIAQGSGDGSAFAIRLKELDALQEGRKLLADTRGAANDLAAQVGRQADVVRQAATAATDSSNQAIAFGTVVMLIIAGASVAGAGLIVWLYIGRNLLARISLLQVTMLRLANGDLSAEIMGHDRGDEIGLMAQALLVFRRNARGAHVAGLRRHCACRQRAPSGGDGPPHAGLRHLSRWRDGQSRPVRLDDARYRDGDVGSGPTDAGTGIGNRRRLRIISRQPGRDRRCLRGDVRQHQRDQPAGLARYAGRAGSGAACGGNGCQGNQHGCLGRQNRRRGTADH
jgi:HAMP domain-containing protein